MKRVFLVVGVFVLLCVLACCVLWNLQGTLHRHIVFRLPQGFFPDVIHIAKNDSITFVNLTLNPSWPAAGPHPTHTSYSDFDVKRGIEPGHFWTFTFAQDGAFTFHDHLAPEKGGIIISGSNDISKVNDQKTCDAITDKRQQASCIEIYFKNIARTQTYPQARAIYEDISARYPDSCHSFAHDLGENAYAAYVKGTLPDIGQEASSCAYGLWHGFTTAMQEDRGFGESKKFCASLTGSTDELTTVNRMNCYHGIGIGLIPDPPPVNNWGNFQAIVDPALNFCDTIPGDPLYKERCLTGVFHAITTYFVNNNYGFTLNEDTLSNCSKLKSEYQYTCFITLASAIPVLTGFDFAHSVAILDKTNLPPDAFKDTLENVAIMSVDMADPVEKMGDFLATCEGVNSKFRPVCLGAVINNIFSNSTPGIEYVKAVAFCSGSWIRSTEKDLCFDGIIGYSQNMYEPKKLEEVCNAIPEDQRARITQCSNFDNQ